MIAEATKGFERLNALKALAEYLAKELDDARGTKEVPQLARQYRETMAEIDAMEAGTDDDDEIAAIIVRNRKSGTN